MNYGIWADIFMEHEYVGGRCEDFTFRPDPPTAETMKREGIMMRETAGGFRLIADEAAFSHEISLVFWAYPVYSNLWNVTEFGEIPADSIPFARIKDESLQWDTTSKSDIPEAMQLPKPMFGMEIVNSQGKSGASITLSLKTKKMKWYYYISGLADNDTAEIVKIKGNKEDSPFDFSQRKLGESVFVSKQEIPLRYGAPPLFQLREKKSSKAIIKCLPNMDARSVSTVILDGKREIVAESFVNT